MIDRRFIMGLVIGVTAVYLYHRVKGIPSNAPGSMRGA